VFKDGSVGWKIFPEDGVDIEKFTKAVNYLDTMTAGNITIRARNGYALAYNEFGDMDKEMLSRAVKMIKNRMAEIEDEVVFFEV